MEVLRVGWRQSVCDVVGIVAFVIWMPLAMVLVIIRWIIGMPLLLHQALELAVLVPRAKRVSPGDGYALVTGAASGIGRAIALELARRGYDLVLADRDVEGLRAAEAETVASARLHAPRDVAVRSVQCDLADPSSVRALTVALADVDVSILVNNAGIGDSGRLHERPEELVASMCRVNVCAATAVVQHFSARMVERGRGHVLNTASVMGFCASPGAAVYCATKAYLLSLSQALEHELRGRGVSVTTLCPGGVRTPFVRAAGLDRTLQKHLMALVYVSADDVARTAVRSMLAGKGVVVTDLVNRLAFVEAVAMLAPASARTWLMSLIWRPSA